MDTPKVDRTGTMADGITVKVKGIEVAASHIIWKGDEVEVIEGDEVTKFTARDNMSVYYLLRCGAPSDDNQEPLLAGSD